MSKRAVFFAACALILTGCALHAKPRLVVSSVPSVAPDGTPQFVMAELTRADNLITADFSATIVKNTLFVRFKEGTALSDRAAAIAAVAGQVIGGWRPGPATEGFYLIRIPVPSGAGLDPVLRACDRLRRLPQVRGVMWHTLHQPMM